MKSRLLIVLIAAATLLSCTPGKNNTLAYFKNLPVTGSDCTAIAASNFAKSGNAAWYLRSAATIGSSFWFVDSYGGPNFYEATDWHGVLPCFCL